MGIAVRNEGSKVNSNINVTPMVDVMLVLLIIFMVITPMLQNKVQIDMAQVDNAVAMPDADKEDAIDNVRTAGVDEVGLLTAKKEGNLPGGE